MNTCFDKYLKYKKKYLNLKNQIGGVYLNDTKERILIEKYIGINDLIAHLHEKRHQFIEQLVTLDKRFELKRINSLDIKLSRDQKIQIIKDNISEENRLDLFLYLYLLNDIESSPILKVYYENILLPMLRIDNPELDKLSHIKEGESVSDTSLIKNRELNNKLVIFYNLTDPYARGTM